MQGLGGGAWRGCEGVEREVLGMTIRERNVREEIVQEILLDQVLRFSKHKGVKQGVVEERFERWKHG